MSELGSASNPSVGYSFNYNTNEIGALAARMQQQANQINAWGTRVDADTQRQLANLQSQNIATAGQYYLPWQEQAAQDMLAWGQSALNQFDPSGNQFGMGEFGQPGTFNRFFEEVGGPSTPFTDINKNDVLLTGDRMNQLVNRGYAGLQQDQSVQGQAGRDIRTGAPMNAAGGLATQQQLVDQDRALKGMQKDMYTQLNLAAPGVNQEGYKTLLARDQAVSADDLARRGLAVGHMGNLMGLFANQQGQYQQWLPGALSAMTSMVNPLNYSYQGRGGEAGKSLLYEAGLHPFQSQLTAEGFQPTQNYADWERQSVFYGPHNRLS